MPTVFTSTHQTQDTSPPWRFKGRCFGSFVIDYLPDGTLIGVELLVDETTSEECAASLSTDSLPYPGDDLQASSPFDMRDYLPETLIKPSVILLHLYRQSELITSTSRRQIVALRTRTEWYPYDGCAFGLSRSAEISSSYAKATFTH